MRIPVVCCLLSCVLDIDYFIEREGKAGRGEAGGARGLLIRLTPGYGHHRHDASPR